MSRTIMFKRRFSAYATVVALVLVSLFPAFMGKHSVSATGQVTSRKITMSSSVISASSVTYAVSFNAATAGTIKGIVVDICQNSPLIGIACTLTNGITSTPTTSTIAVLKNGGGSVSFNVNAQSLSTGRLVLTHATGMTGVSSGDTITFSFTGTNPSGTASTPGAAGTFYGRILTYASDTGGTSPASYTSLAPQTYVDSGGVALSTANQLTINARVQEVLAFCVGTTTIDNATSSVAADCSASFSGSCGNTVDLGVIDSGAVNISPVASGNGGNACNGAAMIRTNANSGATVGYFAVQGSGSNHVGALRVTGATCNAGNVNTDQCIDSQGGTQGTLTAGTEKFGVTVAGINCGSSNTAYTCSYAGGNYNMIRTSNYDGTGSSTTYTAEADRTVTTTTSNGFAWDESGSTTVALASSSTVVEDEVLMLKFAATANLATPSGSYGVVSTYIATATF